ncbi:zinc-finger domain-containing protein [Bacillus mycoides]|uniref:zinc-finger domain-containing protein n=1 Tax=Bacillus mycoides TaxID=1405 RepID=UPI001C032207|nr:zinc-finger domain-containing protein [Bacillus mycoides]QWG87532.1 transposase [Bacillus mycoides]
MTNLRRKILHEIYNLEDTHCSICPLNNPSVNCTDEQEQTKQRNYKHCKGCPIFDSIREKGEKLNSLSKKSTFNKVRERYMVNPFKYLQYKEYSITDVVKETGLTKYQLRKFKQRLE